MLINIFSTKKIKKTAKKNKKKIGGYLTLIMMMIVEFYKVSLERD